MHRKGEQPNIHIQYQCFNDMAITWTDPCFIVKGGAVLDNGFIAENIFLQVYRFKT